MKRHIFPIPVLATKEGEQYHARCPTCSLLAKFTLGSWATYTQQCKHVYAIEKDGEHVAVIFSRA